jgi:adenine phosphoribosyltransferase
MVASDLKKSIREIPDFPKPGITFYDVSTLFRDAGAFRSAVDALVERYKGHSLDAIAGIEARGFVLASAMAYEMNLGLVMIRKFGKLPGQTRGESYKLEYGEAHIEMHTDAVSEGQRILVVDDLLATGGTARAAGRLVERQGASVESFVFLVELGFLKGREQLDGQPVFSLLHYE